MCKHGVLALLISLVSAGAFAQAPPMDMSWAIQQQMRSQAMGDYAARNAAMTYYNYMQQLRAMGYKGPSLPTGVTSQSLRDSVDGANAATQRYIQGSQLNSNRRSNAANDFSMRGIRGCYYARDRWGNLGYACP
jgi:hypothetical protein